MKGTIFQLKTPQQQKTILKKVQANFFFSFGYAFQD